MKTAIPHLTSEHCKRQEARRRSAELYSAVSQTCSLRSVKRIGIAGIFAASAECNPAIQQIGNLRYDAGALPPDLTLTNHKQSFYLCITNSAAACASWFIIE